MKYSRTGDSQTNVPVRLLVCRRRENRAVVMRQEEQIV